MHGKRTRLMLLCCATVAIVLAAGCVTEQQCRDQFGLISKDECEPAVATGSGMAGPPGPIIILKTDAGTGQITWETQQGTDPIVTPTPGGSLFDAGYECELRGDFIGILIDDFEVNSTTKTYPSARKITLVDGTRTLQLQRTSYDTVRWRYRDTSDPAKYCSQLAISTQALDPTKLPAEFFGFPNGGFSDEDGAAATEMKLVVELPVS